MRSGADPGRLQLAARVEEVIDAMLSRWLPRQRSRAHPVLDITREAHRRCLQAGIPLPSRSTVSQRWARHGKAQALRRASTPSAQIPPGHLVADVPLELVQIDHAQADLVVVDEQFRQPIGRHSSAGWLLLPPQPADNMARSGKPCDCTK